MTGIEIVSGLILVSFLIVCLTSMFYERRARISPAPTLPWVRKAIIQELKTRLDTAKPYKFAELGCGWGGINLVLAKNFSESSVIGYEISLFPWIFSKIRAILSFKDIKIVRKSFFEDDLSGFDAVICYLSPWHMEKLKPQLAKLKSGSLIISNAFAIPDWEPLKIMHTDVFMKIPIYVYQIKSNPGRIEYLR